MKRGKPLTRKTPLRARVGLARGASALKRTPLAPISQKRRQRARDEAAQVGREGAAFRQAIHGERCVVCGRSEQEAYDETGYGHQAHHGIRQEVLKRLGLHGLLWDPANAICVCAEPCHRRHSDRKARIAYKALPARVIGFAKRNGLLFELDQEYPA